MNTNLKIAGMLTATLSLGVASAIGAAETAKPNIVILYADDMGYGDVSCYNKDSKIPTVNIDLLAKEGMKFNDAHSSSGICTPSRYAMLTGRYHWRKFHGIASVFGGSVFSAERLTLPEMLKDSGYNTACIGKWHLGFDWDAIKVPEVKKAKNPKLKGSNRKSIYMPDAFDWSKSIPDGPLAHGFDYYFGDGTPNYPPYTWIENDKVTIVPSEPFKPFPKPPEGSAECRPGPVAPGWDLEKVMPTLTEKAVDWISKQKESKKPFFLYFPFTSPHAPIVPSEQFKGKSKAGPYGDFVVQSDWTVGQILKALKDNGFAENTIVIFSADNGPEKYAFSRIQKFNHNSSGELRGLKRDIWEGGHRVPFIVKWPGTVKPASVSNALVSQIDLMATIAGIVDFKLPSEAADDSLDFRSILEGKAKSVRKTLVHNTKPNHYAIRDGKWLFIDASSGQKTTPPQWYSDKYEKNSHPGALYDLSIDPGEKHNLYEKYPEKIKEMKVLLEKVKKEGQRN